MSWLDITKRVRLVVLVVLACLAVGFVRRSMITPPVHHEPNDRVLGRWKAVRASLGLAPLPHAGRKSASIRAGKRASRFDLASKRRAEATRQLPPLHFAPDAVTPTRHDRQKGTRHPPNSPPLAQQKDVNVVS